MKTIQIDGQSYPVTQCPPRRAKGYVEEKPFQNAKITKKGQSQLAVPSENVARNFLDNYFDSLLSTEKAL